MHKGGTLMAASAFTLFERSIDFSLGSQPVSYSIAIIEATMFGMKIRCNGDMIMALLLMLGCLVIDGSLFMQSFCSVYGMRHDVPPLKVC